MTAPWIAEAERAAVIAAQDAIYRTVPGAVIPRWDVAKEVVAAVVPILAEHFAQAWFTDEWGSLADDGERCALCRRKWSKHTDDDGHHYAASDAIRDLAARVIREAATPTEGDQA